MTYFYYRPGKRLTRQRKELRTLCSIDREIWKTNKRKWKDKNKKKTKRWWDRPKIELLRSNWNKILSHRRKVSKIKFLETWTMLNKRKKSKRISCICRSNKNNSKTALSNKWLKINKRKPKTEDKKTSWRSKPRLDNKLKRKWWERNKRDLLMKL